MTGILLFIFYFTLGCLIVYFLRFRKLGNWWVKVSTKQPDFTYFFGPFESSTEAASHQDGYIQDLQEEGVTEIQVCLQKGKPKKLTLAGS
jgi:hypothetical protein